MLIVLTGGARSGKSSLAVKRAAAPRQPVVFIATCPRIDGDKDLERRIAAHEDERPIEWETVETETEIDLASAIADAVDDVTLIVDCLTLWVNNLLHHGHDQGSVDQFCRAAVAAAARRSGETIVVTNEVGLGIVPADELSRRYRDVLG